MLVVMETVAMGDIPVNSTYGQVHLAQPPCCVVGFLAVDADLAFGPSSRPPAGRQVSVAGGVRFYELR